MPLQMVFATSAFWNAATLCDAQQTHKGSCNPSLANLAWLAQIVAWQLFKLDGKLESAQKLTCLGPWTAVGLQLVSSTFSQA